MVKAFDHVDAQLLGRLNLGVGDDQACARNKVVIYGIVSRIVVLHAVAANFVSGWQLVLDLALGDR